MGSLCINRATRRDFNVFFIRNLVRGLKCLNFIFLYLKVYAINVELHIEDTVVDIPFLVSSSIGGGMGGWGEMEMADGQNFIF